VSDVGYAAFPYFSKNTWTLFRVFSELFTVSAALLQNQKGCFSNTVNIYAKEKKLHRKRQFCSCPRRR